MGDFFAAGQWVFFLAGHAADLILIVLAIEAVVLMSVGLRGRRWSGPEVLFALGPGVCLVLALRGALAGADWPWIAIALAASFPLHLADVMRRHRT